MVMLAEESSAVQSPQLIFQAKMKSADTLKGPSIEESFLEDQFEDTDDNGSHPINDLAILSSSILGKMSEHANPEVELEVELHSEVALALGTTQ